MIKKELKTHLKSLIIWSLIVIALYLGIAIYYPYAITDEAMNNMDEFIKVFPPELLKAFNLDMASVSTYYGWLKTEGFTFLLMIVGVYSSLLGGSILLSEESEKTIEYLGSLPIKRSRIVTNKIIVGILYTVIISLAICLANYIALLLSGDFSQEEYFLISLTPIIIGIPLFAINLFISTFMRKTKKIIGISIGMVFIFYIINVISEISSNSEFLKYFSIYTLADIRNIIMEDKINPVMILISLAITLLFIGGTYIRYNKKEFI